MRAKPLFFCLCLLVFLSVSCKKEVSVPEITYEYLPPIPLVLLQEVGNQSTFGDVIFNHYGISMGLPSPAAVKNSINYISQNSVVAANECVADARVIYSTHDAIMNEMDIYISGGCLHVVVLENGIPAYASSLTTNGAQFYTKIVTDFINSNGG